MILDYRVTIPLVLAWGLSSPVYGLPPSWNWVVTNWDSHDPFALNVTGANSDSPGFSQASGVSLISGIPDVTLADGDTIHASGFMTVAGASGFFPIQFRIGLFQEIDPGPSTGDGAGYRGITIENDGFLKETVGIAPNPFSSTGAINISPGIGIGTLNQPNFTAELSLDIRRDGNAFDVNGFITTGPQYFEQFFIDNYPPQLGFAFNRLGFLVGRMVTVNSVNLSTIKVSVVPEPATALLSLIGLVGIGQLNSRRPTALGRATQPDFPGNTTRSSFFNGS